jgi:hypothetical protein
VQELNLEALNLLFDVNASLKLAENRPLPALVCMTVTIIISTHRPRSHLFEAGLEGRVLCVSRQPLLDAARTGCPRRRRRITYPPKKVRDPRRPVLRGHPGMKFGRPQKNTCVHLNLGGELVTAGGRGFFSKVMFAHVIYFTYSTRSRMYNEDAH